jgi:hypothetical protein
MVEGLLLLLLLCAELRGRRGANSPNCGCEGEAKFGVCGEESGSTGGGEVGRARL